MKRISLIVVALLALASSAMAETLAGKVQWYTGVGVYWNGSTSESFDDWATDGILVNYDVLWQLIHTADGQTHNPVWSDPNYLDSQYEELVSADSYRLGGASYFESQYGLDVSLYKDDASTLTTPLSMDESLDHYYVYQRIFQLEQGTTEPNEGSPKWVSGVTDIRPQFDGQINSAVVPVEYDGTIVRETPIRTSVPEPATMSLLGLGALAMVLRRKLRK